ncbi:uncharacterized protein LOC143227865 [Tachypleus tridentatus]|uniref:uncharacterized protein LOC143227865 n=1 Tax=Tachypleus tridentatus TaxID=6853 RepID=UPI003FD2A15C
MKFLFVLPLFFAACMAEMLLNFDPEKGTFMYATGDEGKHTRDETRESDGSVTGMYSYIDPNGNLRQVRYRAGPKGFKPEGDISVDKKTSEEAAKINVMAPKAPKTPAVPETPKVVETPIVPKVAEMPDMLFNFDPEKGTFMYATGDEGKHTRDETWESDGSVTGMYSYMDPNGNLRQVRYRAGPKGFKPEGDIGVDKKTSEEAAKITAMAPKAPKTPTVPETPKVLETPIVPKVAEMPDMLFNFDPEKGTFMYATGDEGKHTRDETWESDGLVTGMYSYMDPNGNLRQVRYRAGPKGFKPEGDIGVDKKTSEEAARIAAMKPKALEVPKVPSIPQDPVSAEIPDTSKIPFLPYSPFFSRPFAAPRYNPFLNHFSLPLIYNRLLTPQFKLV